MSEPEQQIAHAVIQQISSTGGVSWEVFKWSFGILMIYITGAYGLSWKLFSLFRQDRDKLSDKIDVLRSNDIKHLEDRLNKFEARMPK